MKSLLLIPLFITSVLCSYLTGLNRTFDEAELKIVDLYVTMPSSEVNKLIQKAQISVNDVKNNGYGKSPDFKYENAKIVAKYNGNEKTFEKVSFKTGGMYARSNDMVGFNIKLDKKLFGRKNIRVRPDPNDRSHLRSKLCCDIANRIGLPSIQATYARLYMNNEYWGLYTLMDSIKPSWVKQTFNPKEEEITTLYQCKAGGFHFRTSNVNQCINANDDYQHMSVFRKFVEDVNACKTVQQVEKILDVKGFLKYLAFEWLIGSFDHFLINGHNFDFYKKESDGKWIIVYYDYDNTFGNSLSSKYWDNKGPNQDGSGGVNQWGGNARGNNPINYSFADWEMNIPIVNTLVHKNKSQFKKLVREILVSAFNPNILNPHISELKHFLRPYVKEDTTPGKDGRLPGRINKKGSKHNTSVRDFENNIESSIKTWISTKFDVACRNYGFNKQDILNESAKYVPKGYDYPANHKEPKQKTTTTILTTTTTIIKSTTTTTVNPKTTTSTTVKPKTTTTTTTKSKTATTSTIIPTPEKCTSITEGYYPCGGLNYPDASPCCEEGFQCEFVNEYYYRCALITN